MAEKGVDIGRSWDAVADAWHKESKPIFRGGDLVWGPFGPREKDAKLIPTPRGKKVLVAGCGDGQDILWLIRRGASVIGIDVSRRQLEIARERILKTNHRPELLQKDLEKIYTNQFPKAYFDIIISNYAFQYIKNLRRLFTTLASFLKPRGKIIFSLDHPILYARYPKYRKRKGHLPKNTDYLNERTLFWHFRVGKPVKAYSYHRTMSSIFNSLVSSGFSVEKILEPKPSIRSAGGYRTSYNKARRIPYTIIFVATKS